MRSLLMSLMVLTATLGLAKTTASDIPVTTYLADFDGTITTYYVQSEGGGAYKNGMNSVTRFWWQTATTTSSTATGAWTFQFDSSHLRSELQQQQCCTTGGLGVPSAR
jgi:hypothetical protein